VSEGSSRYPVPHRCMNPCVGLHVHPVQTLSVVSAMLQSVFSMNCDCFKDVPVFVNESSREAAALEVRWTLITAGGRVSHQPGCEYRLVEFIFSSLRAAQACRVLVVCVQG